MKKDIGELLVDNGQITEEELQGARKEAPSTGEPIGTVLIRLGLVNEDNLKTVLELNYEVSYLDLRKTIPSPGIVALLPYEVVLEYSAVPVQVTGNRLTLAMVNPADNEGLAKITEYLQDWQLNLAVCSDDGFQDFMSRAYPRGSSNIAGADQTVGAQAVKADQEENNQEDFIDLSNVSDSDLAVLDIEEGRAIGLLSQHILANAINRGCTNIHIEPGERQVLVHYRKEGVLFAARKLHKSVLPELVQRFKTMTTQGGAGLDLPLDGLLKVRHNGQNFYCRLSIVPGIYGEHLVIWLE